MSGCTGCGRFSFPHPTLCWWCASPSKTEEERAEFIQAGIRHAETAKQTLSYEELAKMKREGTLAKYVRQEKRRLKQVREAVEKVKKKGT